MDVISLYFIASYYYSCRRATPPSPLANPSPTNTIATTRHYHHAARSRPSRSVLLSRASHRAGGIHSRNSLLRSLFCCNHCYPPYLLVSPPQLLPLLKILKINLLSSFLPFFFPFDSIDFDLSSIPSPPLELRNDKCNYLPPQFGSARLYFIFLRI